jgi:hypothetical protein
MSPIRFIFSAAAMPSDQALMLVHLACQDAPPAHARTRKRLKQRFKRSLIRVLNFAKHETLRKMHRYLYSHRAITGQEHPGAARITFNQDELLQDLQSLIYSEIPGMLEDTTKATLDSVGSSLPWTMPTQDVLDFIASRERLLSGLPQEFYQKILGEVSAGLTAGDSLADLSNRISAAFNSIEEGQADVIADTETAAAFNYATDKAARAAGVEYKQWVHGGSLVPREDHLAIDGLVVPIAEPFPVGDPPLMFPHDPGGSPEDVINCSCVSLPATADQYEG